MYKIYSASILSLLVVLGLSSASCAQNSKVKTITIINGDTTISEKNMDEKELADIDKKIRIMIKEDGDSSSKKIVKKITINTDKEGDDKAMAYAYSIGDDKDQDVEISTDDNKETKIIIKKGDDKTTGSEKNDPKEKKTIIKKSVSATNDKKENESLNVNIMIKNTTAKLEVESNSKEPLNVSILDENGKQVFYDSQKTGNKYSKEISLGKKGTYFLNLIQNKKSTTEKIIVE